MSGVKVETTSKEATGVLASDSVVFKHSHTTASKKLRNPVKGMFTFLQNRLSGYWDMSISYWSTVLRNIKSRLPFSFDHIIIMLTSPCNCLVIAIFIAGHEGGEVRYGKS